MTSLARLTYLTVLESTSYDIRDLKTFQSSLVGTTDRLEITSQMDRQIILHELSFCCLLIKIAFLIDRLIAPLRQYKHSLHVVVVINR